MPPELFYTAQGILRERAHRFSNEELIEKLRRLFQQHGYLSGLIIDEAEGMPSAAAYAHRFGSLIRAYQTVGFTPDRDYQYLEVNQFLRRLHPEIVGQTERMIAEVGGAVVRDPATDLLTVNREFTVSLVLSRCQLLDDDRRRWNRFLMIWAERSRMLPFPKETPQAVVEHLARRTLEVLTFVRADRHDEREHLRMELSPQAQWRYAQLYRGELHDGIDDVAIGALLERRAPMLLRLAMLMALTDLQTRIDVPHIDAAMAWIRHATASVRFVFVSAAEEAKLAEVLELANRVLAFLHERGQATRSQISAECFRGKVPKARIDACLEYLLASTPPKVTVQWGERADGAPGAPLRVYRLAAE